MVDKELAVSLRLEGLSYKEIATHLNCSFAWCAKNLSGVEKGKCKREIVDATKESAIAILKEALARLESL